MGFWKSLGKAALTYGAPLASGFIPGVGPLASMAISGGIGAATNAVNAGKGNRANAALQGGISGATEGYNKGKANKGIGPSNNAKPSLSNRVGLPPGVMNYGSNGPSARAGGGFNVPEGSISDIPGRFGSGGGGDIPTIGSRSIFNPRQVFNPNTARVPEGNVSDITKIFGDTRNPGGGKSGFDWKDLLLKGGTAAAGIYGAKKLADMTKPEDIGSKYGPEEQYGRGTGRELGGRYTFGQGKDQRAPNLADTISQGRRDAIKSQPWRDVEYERVADKPMNIYPNAGKKRRKTYQEQAEE